MKEVTEMTNEALSLAALPDILTANHLMELFHISHAGAYNLLNSADFPTLHVGGRKMVTKDNLLTWMERNTNRIA